VAIQYSGEQYSNAGGTAVFSAAPGQALLQVSKAGYQSYSKPLSLNADQSVLVKLKALSGIGWHEYDAAAEVKFWPNPAGDELRLSAVRPYEVKLYSSDGRLQMQMQMRSLTETMDVSQLKPGIYLLQFSDGVHSFSRKVVKK
jgi:hypothetical protein